MKKYSISQGDLYAGDHELIEFAEKIDPLSSLTIEQQFQELADSYLEDIFKGREDFERYIKLFGKINHLNDYAILFAHGGEVNGNWTYCDNGKDIKVQNWVNKTDGKYAGLILCSCNPGSYSLISKKSVLVYSDSDIDFIGGGGEITGRNVCFDLYVPKKGNIDSYVMGVELEELERKLGIKSLG